MYLQYLWNQEFVVRIFNAKICQLILFFVRKLLVDDLVDLFFGAMEVSKENTSHANS